MRQPCFACKFACKIILSYLCNRIRVEPRGRCLQSCL